MQVLPTGFALPPTPYLIGLLGATLVVGVLLVAVKPPVDQRLAVALVPWIAIGGALHAFYQIGAYPPPYRPLFGAPAVYLTTFVLTAAAWLLYVVVAMARGRPGNVVRNLGLSGSAVLVVILTVVVVGSAGEGVLEPVWPAIALVIALVLTAVTVFLISLWRTPVFVRTRFVGPVVVFAHALDGVSTAIGADVFGVGERSPLPRAILQFAEMLPTAELLGVGWLFLFVKLVVAAAVVIAFNRFLAEDPVEATLLLVVVTAVGLGPATNNLFLFLSGAA